MCYSNQTFQWWYEEKNKKKNAGVLVSWIDSGNHTQKPNKHRSLKSSDVIPPVLSRSSQTVARTRHKIDSLCLGFFFFFLEGWAGGVGGGTSAATCVTFQSQNKPCNINAYQLLLCFRVRKLNLIKNTGKTPAFVRRRTAPCRSGTAQIHGREKHERAYYIAFHLKNALSLKRRLDFFSAREYWRETWMSWRFLNFVLP